MTDHTMAIDTIQRIDRRIEKAMAEKDNEALMKALADMKQAIKAIGDSLPLPPGSAMTQ